MLGLKKLRIKEGFTQSELAEKFNVSTNTVWRWEASTQLPSIELLKEIAEFFDVTVDELLNGGDKDLFLGKWEIKVVWAEPEEVDEMNLSANSPHKAIVEIGTDKVGVKVVGKVENAAELDSVLAEMRSKALDALGLQDKWRSDAV